MLRLPYAVRRRIWKGDYLSHHVEQKLSKGQSPIERQRSDQFWGSRSGAVSIAAIVLLLEILALGLGNYLVQDTPRVAEYASVLWRVQTALLSVAFVVIVLLMQVLGGRDQFSMFLFRSYVRRSYILSAAFLGISTVASMGVVAFIDSYALASSSAVAAATILNTLLLGVNLVAIAFVYQRIVRFLAPGHSNQLTKELLYEAIQEHIDERIHRALAKQLLAKEAGKVELRYRPAFPPRGSAEPVEYPLNKGIREIRDVNLEKLGRFAEKLATDQVPKAWIKAGLGDTLSAQNPEIGYLRSESVDPDRIRSLIDCYYVVETSGRSNDVWEEWRRDLRSRIYRSIHERRSGKLADLLDTYVKVLNLYSFYIQQYEPSHLNLAFENQLFAWSPDEDLYHDVLRVAKWAINTDDQRFFDGLLYLPRKVMRFAHSRRNFKMYRRFAEAYRHFYAQAQRLPFDSESRSLIIESSWRYLRDLSLHLETEHRNPDEIVADAKYAVAIIEVFNLLLKQALKARDYEAFDLFSEVLESLFEDAKGSYYHLRSQRQRLELSTGGKTDEESTLQQVQVLKRAESALQRIEQSKNLVWFGIGAWVLDLYHRDQIDEKQLSKVIQNSFSRFKRLEDLYETYQDTEESRQRFNWPQWDSEREAKNSVRIEARPVTTDKWLRRFYVVRGLQLVRPGTEASVYPSRFVKKELPSLRNVCDEIQEEGHPLLDYEDLGDRIEAFLELHREAKNRQEETEADELIEAKLDVEPQEAFRAALVNAWEAHKVERLVQPFISVQEVDEDEITITEEDQLHFRKLRPKEYFVTGRSPEGAPSLGKQWGGIIAREERYRLFHALCDSLPKITTSPQGLGDSIEEAIERLKGRNAEPDVLFIGTRKLLSCLRRDNRFIPKWKEAEPSLEISSYSGSFKGVPVCIISADAQSLVLVNLSKSLLLRRLLIENENPLTVEIEQLDEARAQELVATFPELKENLASNRTLSREEAIRKLLQKVLLNMKTGLRYQIAHKSGTVITLQDKNGLKERAQNLVERVKQIWPFGSK